MARYQDYVKQDDELDNEIQDAAEQTEDRKNADNPTTFDLPDRFKDKSAEEIAQSYIELEKAYSRQGNDLGRMRETYDKFIENLQSDEATTNASDEATAPASIDDLYDDTEGTIARVANREVGSRVEKLEQELAQARLQTKIDALGEKFGDWQSTVQSDEFLNWVQESPYRLRMAQQADKFDMDAAEEILGLWNDRKGLTDLRQEAERDRRLSEASLESSSAEAPRSEKKYSRSEIMENRIRANHGDPQAQDWLRAHAEGIAIAYEEGNLTD